ncbi:MAG: hypothetical protein IPL46_19805 [Saprospiraceae bacterium]|nr:hypothetical protein [Saprospiraceae bacterium]
MLNHRMLLFFLCWKISLIAMGQVLPVPNSHAHNDYLHERPLQDALALGFVSVEADILLGEDHLFVGHNREDLLIKPLDFESVYLQPLYQRYLAHSKSIYPEYGDLFYLWLDIKYDGATVLNLLKKLIRPYRKMLFSERRNRNGRVMILISGDRPMDLLLADKSGYFHIDGRPADLLKSFDRARMPFISQNMKEVCSTNENDYLDISEKNKLVKLVEQCHQQNKKIRLWATPENEQLWQQFLEIKLDLINTDSLQRLASFLMTHK